MQIDAERRRLPAPVPVPSARAVVGSWVDDHGTAHELASGEQDAWHAPAVDFARARGWAPGRSRLWLARHIEFKFALRMRAEGLTEETIVIRRAGSTSPEASANCSRR